MRTVFMAVLLTASSIGAWAQSVSTAQISGGVKDQTGAVLPGVEIVVTHTDTGLQRTALTDETGSYVVTNLPIGPYRLEAALPGFRTYVQTGIVLQVSGNPQINLVLEVGQVTDQVEVEADAALVETRSTGIGQVIDNVRVLELPLNGRNVVELILLSGSAVGGQPQMTNRNFPTDSISVAGGLSTGLTYLLDGGTHNDPFNDLNLPLPFPDALQEFKVETSALTAQYGQHSAAAVNAVTRSGTNAFHGSLFEFVRNGSLNARNTFALTRDSLKRNQFGGTLGGPVMRNKLFFFGGYQGTTLRSAPTENFAYIPTAKMLAGDWTDIASPACNSGRQIALRAPFVNGRIDPALFVAPALNLLKRLPSTTDPCGQVQFGRRSISDEFMVVGKVDYQMSEKHSLFGRYEVAHADLPTDYDGVNILTWANTDYKHSAHSFVLGDTYLISAGTVSSFRGAVLRTTNPKVAPELFTLSDIGVKNYYYPPSGFGKIPLVAVAGGFTLGSQPATPGETASTVLQFAEDISMVTGTHQIGFGVNFIHAKMNVHATTVMPGQMNFAATNTGLGLGDFMLGRLSQWQQQSPVGWYMRHNYVGAYLQDTWKPTSRITLNLGVRWEPYLASWEKTGQIAYFDEAAFDQGLRSVVYKNAPAGLRFSGDSGTPDSKKYGPSTWPRFGPRVGLAWDPKGDGLMTLRGAYGLFFDYPHLWHYSGIYKQAPWGYIVSVTNPAGGFEDPWQGYPGGNPFPVVVNPNIAFPVSGAYVNIPLTKQPPYVHQWNVSLQRQIGTDWLVSGNYIGSSAIHLPEPGEINPAVYLPGSSCVIAGRTFTPCSSTANTIQRRRLSLENPDQGQYYGNITTIDDGGTHNYNGLALSLQRRRTKGLTVQTNYTWSHCIDDGTPNNFEARNGGPLLERRGANRGNCDSDRRHNFNMSTVYATPEFSNAAVRALASGWKVSGIVRVSSGRYLTVTSGLDNALTATTDQRPNQVLSSPYVAVKSQTQWLNPSAFAQPASGTYGNLGASNILAPGTIRVDMGLTRTFQVRETQTIEFRAEAFNLPNHVNPGAPTTVLTNNNFGRIQSADDPRIMQVALKFVF